MLVRTLPVSPNSRRRLVLTVLVAGLLMLPARAQTQPRTSTLPQDTRVNITTTILSPVIIYAMRQMAKSDPTNTIFKVDSAGFGGVTSSGNPAGVAEYTPLASWVRIHNLYFLKAFKAATVSFQADVTGDQSMRLRAVYDNPGTARVEATQTKVFHRLEHRTTGIVDDHNPSDSYALEWQRFHAKARVNLGTNSPVAVTASFDNQTRTGLAQHSWFDIHRFNCTDCHTQSTSIGLSQNTQSYKVGLEGRIAPRDLVEGSVGESRYTGDDQTPTFNYGGPFGDSPVVSNNRSHDQTQQFRAGFGDQSYRVGLSYYGLQRKNQNINATLHSDYLSFHGAAQLSDQVFVTGGLTSVRHSQSLSQNLDSDSTRMYLQLNANPATWARMTAKVGQDRTQRRLLGIGYPNTNDRYYDVRLGLRPTNMVKLDTSFRHDNMTDPFFPTDPGDRAVFQARATISPNPVVMGVDYQHTKETNSSYAMEDESTDAFVTALLDPVVVNATYSVDDINSNISQPIFLNDALGVPLELQDSYPYNALTQTFELGVDFPIGKLWVRPSYTKTHSRSQALFLRDVFPVITGDSAVDLVQESWALRLDYPLWSDGQIGVGWEHQNWLDQISGQLNGTYNIYSVYFSTRY